MGNQSAITDPEIRGGRKVLLPRVGVGPGGTELPPEALSRLVRAVVDSDLLLPDMFTLTFADPNHDVLTKAGMKLGSVVLIKGQVSEGGSEQVLVSGEVTSIEGDYGSGTALTVVRGYSQDHRLQRARHTRTFLNAADSDAARQIATAAGVKVATIVPSRPVHPHLGQVNQTDWEFLAARAQEIGYEFGVAPTGFFFRPIGSVKLPPIPADPAKNLVRFRPRVSAANLVGEVEVRAWDPTNAKALAVKKPIKATGTVVGAGTPVAAVSPFKPKGAAAKPPAASKTAAGSGPPPSVNGHVVQAGGISVPNGSTASVTAAATALSEAATSGFAEAEGEIHGDGRAVAGAKLKITGVPLPFAGNWTITSARHVFDRNDGGYRTQFQVSGRQDRSLLALSAPGATGGPDHVPGVVCGLVTDVNDPLGLGRVKVILPWLSPDYETDWAPVSQLGASDKAGAMFLPGPRDQVLVAFEHGDLRRPYVLGSVVNNRTGAGGILGMGGGTPGKTAVKAGNPASVIRRGIRSPAGSQLVFHDEVPPMGGRPTVAAIRLGTDREKLAVVMDHVSGTMTITCKPGAPPGRLTIECDGDIDVKAGPAGRLTVDGGMALTLKAKTVEIDSAGPLIAKGKPIKLN